jgi:hypothetical protein
LSRVKWGLSVLILLAFASFAHAEMVWVGLDPTPKATSKSAQADLESYVNTYLRDDLRSGQDISLVVNDSSANADSTYVTYYSYPINTENVISATGEINLMAVTDTSTDAASAFYQYGDSVFVYYALKTGNIPYDTSCDYTITAYTAVTTVSGTVNRIALTVVPATANIDTLFKAWTWFEVTFVDTTRWGDRYTQYWRISGTGDSACTIAGTYNAVGPDYFKYWFSNVGGTPDSIGWCHATAAGVNSGTIDTAAITGSAQNLDSGMTINFDATTGHTKNDTFMFVAADSLWYGKTTQFTLRMGLNLKRIK